MALDGAPLVIVQISCHATTFGASYPKSGRMFHCCHTTNLRQTMTTWSNTMAMSQVILSTMKSPSFSMGLEASSPRTLDDSAAAAGDGLRSLPTFSSSRDKRGVAGDYTDSTQS